MFCPWCGTQNPEDAAVCQNCGRPLRPAAGGPPPSVIPAPPAGAVPQGFFAKLFDFSFRGFITPTIIAIVYGIVLVLVGLSTIFAIVWGFRVGTGLGVVLLIFSPLIFLIYVIFARMWLEMTVVLFRIAQDVGEIARMKRG